MTSQEVIHACDRAIAGAQELKAAAIQMQQSDQQIREKQSTLAALEANIAQIKPMVAQVEELDQRIRSKRHELAELELQISKKSVEHGTIDGELRNLMKRASSLVQSV
jgi:hypothetical protein